MGLRDELDGACHAALRRLFDALPADFSVLESPDGCQICQAEVALEAWEKHDRSVLDRWHFDAKNEASGASRVRERACPHVTSSIAYVLRTSTTSEVCLLPGEGPELENGNVIDDETTLLYFAWKTMLEEMLITSPNPNRVRKTPGPRLTKLLGRALRESSFEECKAAVRGAYLDWGRRGIRGKSLADVFSTFRNTGSLPSRIAYFAELGGYSPQTRGLDAPGVRSRLQDVRRELRAAIDLPNSPGAQRRAAEAERWLADIGLCVRMIGHAFVIEDGPNAGNFTSDAEAKVPRHG